MAQRAQVHLSFARQLAQADHHSRARSLVILGPKLRYMLGAPAVALLARNPDDEICLLVVVFRMSRLKVCGMAFQAARRDGTVEVSKSVLIARTVHPLLQFRPIRDRQFEELIALPIQICLALAAGANDKIHPLGVGARLRWCAHHSALKILAVASFHTIGEFRISRRQNILPRREAACDGFAAG